MNNRKYKRGELLEIRVPSDKNDYFVYSSQFSYVHDELVDYEFKYEDRMFVDFHLNLHLNRQQKTLEHLTSGYILSAIYDSKFLSPN